MLDVAEVDTGLRITSPEVSRLSLAALTLTNCDVADLTVDADEIEFHRLVNEYRIQNGLQPTIMSTHVNRVASWMAIDLANRSDYPPYNHIDTLGRGPSQRRIDCGAYPGYGEITSYGYYTPREAFEGFRSSPAHNSNMLVVDAVQVGIAHYYLSGSNYRHYWVMDQQWADDGTRIDEVATPTPQPISTATAAPIATATKTATPTRIATATKTITPTKSPTPFPKRECQGRWGNTIEKNYGLLTKAECDSKFQ